MKKVVFITLIVTMYTSIFAQNTTKWNGKQFAVALTYDDGLNVHLDNAIPALNKYNLRGTFYIPAQSTISIRMDDWRQAVKDGHELGNHTLFHPCNGAIEGREWVSKDYDLSNYSLNQIKNEILVANTLLKAVDGKTNRTFAYTCGDYEAEGTSFMDFIGENFAGARGVASGSNSLENANILNIDAYGINGETGSQLIDIVNQAMMKNELVVFLFHGVGGEHNINVSLEAHEELLKYLKSIEDKVWNAPLVEIANYIKNNRLSE